MFFICCMTCFIFLIILESFCTGPMSNTFFCQNYKDFRKFSDPIPDRVRPTSDLTKLWIILSAATTESEIGVLEETRWWRMQGSPWGTRCTSPVYCEQLGKATLVSKARAAQKNSQWGRGDGHSRQRGQHKVTRVESSHSGSGAGGLVENDWPGRVLGRESASECLSRLLIWIWKMTGLPEFQFKLS